jgi:hypothetical protein
MPLLFAAVTAAARNRRVVEPPVAGATITYAGLDEDSTETGFLHQARPFGSADAYTTYGTSAALTGSGLTFSVAVDGHPFNTDLEARTVATNGTGIIYAYDPIRVRTVPEFGPTALTVSAIAAYSATVTFTPPTPAPLTGYRIYIRESLGPWILFASAASGASSCVIEGLAPETVYEVAASSYNENEEGVGDAETALSTPVGFTSAEALPVIWESPISVSIAGDTVVSTEGTLVPNGAVNLGEATDREVNGVVFSGTISRDDLAEGAVLAALYTDGGIGTQFTGMMQSLSYAVGSADIVLTGLTSGKEYLLQVFMSDDRSESGYGARTQHYTIAGVTSGDPAYNTSYAMICRFQATGNTQTLTIGGGTTSHSHLSAFQVRDLT